MKHQRENSTVYLIDCLEYMKTIPDKYYNLALVDPPYGLNVASKIGGIGGVNKNGNAKWKNQKLNDYLIKEWDIEPPPKEYFDELFRISNNQIIFGANHFISRMPFDSASWIVWDKKQVVIIQTVNWLGVVLKEQTVYSNGCGMDLGSNSQNTESTQPKKPIALYDWIYKNYLPNGGKVFDSHLGSQSNRISAFKRGNIIFDACELDVDYFNDGNDRYDEFLMKYQPAELNPITKQGQHKLF